MNNNDFYHMLSSLAFIECDASVDSVEAQGLIVVHSRTSVVSNNNNASTGETTLP